MIQNSGGLDEGYRRGAGMMGGVYEMLVSNVRRIVLTSGGPSTELALPRGPDSIKAFALAG